MNYVPLLAVLLVAGCAAPCPVLTPAGHPAAPTAPSSALYAETSPLPPAPQPDLPPPLRPDETPLATDPGGPAALAEPEHAPTRRGRAPDRFAEVLDAYLALQESLAADRLDGIGEQARVFGTTLMALAESAPADAPHFWHERAAETDGIRAHAHALSRATDLGAARAAFGALSPPFAALVETVGVPAGYDLARFTCSMADAAEGGVWLQREGEAQNPFFGPAMASCGSRDETLGGTPEHGAVEGPHDH